MILEPEVRSRLERLALHSRGRVRGLWAGGHPSVRKGESLDFADYREYTPGDDFRRIDHNLRARLGVTLVRLYEAEDELPLRVLCDVSASMGFGGKFAAVRRLAAAITYLALASGDRVTPLAVPGAQGRVLDQGRPARHVGGWPAVETWLEMLRPGGAADLTGALRLLRERAGTRGPTALVSDLLAPDWPQALDLIGSARAGGLVVHLLDPTELEPDLMGDLRLVDAETGVTLDLSTSDDAYAAYRAARDAFLADAARRARRNGLDYVLIPAGPDALDRLVGGLAAAGAVR